MATPTKPMSFADFEQLPDREGYRMELHHGEVVYVPPANCKHLFVQDQIRSLLQNAAGEVGKAATEFGFRPVPEYEYWVADVGFTVLSRWKGMQAKAYFEGSPELVVEVLSPSNRRGKMQNKESLCLENGAKQFWRVDLERREVKVSTHEGKIITYRGGDEIPLFIAAGATLSVDAIFAPLAE